MSTVGGYLEHRGGYSVPWGDIMSTVGVFSTVAGYHPLKFEYRGGYHEYCGGCSVPWGTQITKDSPHGTEHLPGTHDIPPHAS